MMQVPPTGIGADQARGLIALLDVVLALPGIDPDTARRAEWLRMRLCELVPERRRPAFDTIEARIALLLPAEAEHRAARYGW